MIPLTITALFGTVFIIQTTLLKMFGSLAPDTMLLAAVYCGLKYGKINGYEVGIIAGIAQDILAFGMLGINMLSKGLTGFAAGLLKENNVIDPGSATAWSFLIITGTALNEIILRLYLIGFGNAHIYFADSLAAIGMQVTLNLLLGIPLFVIADELLKWVKDAFGIREY